MTIARSIFVLAALASIPAISNEIEDLKRIVAMQQGQIAAMQAPKYTNHHREFKADGVPRFAKRFNNPKGRYLVTWNVFSQIPNQSGTPAHIGRFCVYVGKDTSELPDELHVGCPDSVEGKYTLLARDDQWHLREQRDAVYVSHGNVLIDLPSDAEARIVVCAYGSCGQANKNTVLEVDINQVGP